MPYVITRMCTWQGICADVCPTDSIHFVEEDLDWPTYYINPETCIDCGACASECPTGAIFLEEEVPEEYLDDIDANADFFLSGPGVEFV